jgi:hypothetical protein
MTNEVDVRAHEVEIENVRAVGIADLRVVASHTVVRSREGTTYDLEFRGGSRAEVRYGEDGKLRQVTAEGCGVTWTADGALLLRTTGD